MKKYTYTNHESGDVVVFFGNNILEADRQYKEAGYGNVEMQSHVGCAIEKVEEQ